MASITVGTRPSTLQTNARSNQTFHESPLFHSFVRPPSVRSFVRPSPVGGCVGGWGGCRYIGWSSHGMREAAAVQIADRIARGQLRWGALVFTRDRKNRLCLRPGSKAWFCRAVRAR